MTLEQKGHCKHGEFALLAGCSQCIAERFHLAEKKNLIKVRYYSDTPEGLSSREYTYYTAESLKVGDIVIVPVRDTTCKAQVSAIDVPESEVAAFKDKLKTIPAGSVPQTETEKQADGDGVTVLNDGSVLVAINPQYDSEERPGSLTTLDPQKDSVVMSFWQQALSAQSFAEKRVIKNAEDMKSASDDLNLIRKLKKAMDSRRKDYLEPFQAHVKEVNESYKRLMAPVEEADKITADKMLAYTAEQNRIRQEQERINAERIKLAQDEMKLKGELTESVKLVEVIPPVATTTKTELGSTGLRDHWVFEVVNFALLPDEYKIADTAKLGKVVRAGLHVIPGVKIENKPILAVGK